MDEQIRRRDAVPTIGKSLLRPAITVSATLNPRPLPELIVTRDGVPFADQAEGRRLFAAACVRVEPL